MWDLARRLEGRMAATGMEALLTRREDTCPTEAERAAFANDAGADIVLSLHVDANHSMHAAGPGDVPLRQRLGHHVDRRARRSPASSTAS